MNERDFIFWLSGFFELFESKELTEKQVNIIKERLKLMTDRLECPNWPLIGNGTSDPGVLKPPFTVTSSGSKL